MHKTLSLLPFLLLASPAALAIECTNGNSSEVLSFGDWALSQDADDQDVITITLEPQAERGIRLIDAMVRLEDVLGDRIGEFALDRDTAIPPEGTFNHEQVITGSALERLQSIHVDDVMGIVCVSALVFDDGTIEQYSE
ncbi:hypothetical protein [Pelagibacterium luteolum]|uniref:Uncharacterized protein n=1 Tax=Pelagibacterium luteolum TaxID=440168 RepID=A0A1G7Y2X3_9HYPH|nr:hypothetical protein [Pelagibacterium luteolum]SDG90717.1 hypothetical protein SAMN04487974_11219 [Pelagibacterium luteolum]